MEGIVKTRLVVFGVVSLSLTALAIVIAARQGTGRPTPHALPALYREPVLIEGENRECPPPMIKGTSTVIPITASGDFCASMPKPTGWKDLRYVGHPSPGTVLISLVLFTVVVGSFFGVGLILIIGTLMGWTSLVHPPESGVLRYLYDPLREQFGDKGVACLHLFVGISFVLGSIWFTVYVVFLA
jgi:hypothetical protein